MHFKTCFGSCGLKRINHKTFAEASLRMKNQILAETVDESRPTHARAE